uniref:VTT domain-containing protein n=1 Tax=Hemiselmis andersenii TaxID=464988 RepID=A0A6U4KZU7_HEMAN|mmetsp:Transcript_24400/g.56586  ORF Transcript_24400/g.56586 Transcript_24400/m.56586 type:complete len:233 (-) Transcript_24400:139-837(-)|eukprot:CAMPEP_0114122892 /NCGR_PEP_ID=MMETSP0043_2-20121206/7935_1 /TAXON_ID=464988 /ORGANISM="Hemiselmis andersenii, Strain CCMP644" /LENGTH=232 /DNA_ID=CAMNT_0001215633 /DNA_START=168 /DNA_END=866 /DNA_ORIENTATION=+
MVDLRQSSFGVIVSGVVLFLLVAAQVCSGEVAVGDGGPEGQAVAGTQDKGQGGADETCDPKVPAAGKAAIIIAAFEAFKSHPLGWLGFILWLTVWSTCALPVTPIEVCAGFVFGPVWGTVGSLIAKTAGCMMAMVIGRSVGRAQGWKMPEQLEKYMSFLLRNPLQAMCVIRVAPIPQGIKNYGLSLVPFPGGKYPVKEYFWACVLVGAPFSIAWCLTGAGASSLLEIAARYT